MAESYSVAEVIRGQLRSAPAAETVRDIEAVTGEIIHLKQELARNIVDIGLRLIEAKTMLPHGEWLSWLSERVCYSEKTAQNYMRVAREFPNPQLVADLGVRKALALLELPPSEREEFAEDNNVVDMTTAELEKALRERDEARKAAEAAQAEARTAGEARARMEADMKVLEEIHRSAQEGEAQAREALAKAQTELEELRKRPVDVAVETVVDREAVEKARAEAVAEMQARVDQAEKARKEAEAKRKEIEKALAEAKKQAGANAAILSRAEKAEAEKQALEEARKKAEAELAEARRQLEAAGKAGAQSAISSDADLASFKLLLDQAVTTLNQMLGLHMKIQGRDAESGEKCRRALIAYFDEGRKRV